MPDLWFIELTGKSICLLLFLMGLTVVIVKIGEKDEYRKLELEVQRSEHSISRV